MEESKEYTIKSCIFDNIEFKPLDLVGFRGSDIVSSIIAKIQDKMLDDERFTHVGIVVTKELMPFVEEMEEGEIYVWESTYSGPVFSDGSKNIEKESHFFGVQIRNLKDVVSGYTKKKSAKVALCKLSNNPWDKEKNRKKIIKKFESVHSEYGMSLYEINPLGLLSMIFRCLRPARDVTDSMICKIKSHMEDIIIISPDMERYERHIEEEDFDEAFLFCSELVSMLYKIIGLMIEIEPSDMFPMDIVNYPGLISEITYIEKKEET